MTPSDAAVTPSARRSGAPMVRREGRTGVCRHAVGLGSREDRETYELVGPPECLRAATQLLTGRVLTAGTGVHLDGSWLCRTTEDRVLVRFRTRDAEHALERLRAAAGRQLSLGDVGADHATVDLVGPHLAGPPPPGARLDPRIVPALLVADDAHLADVAGPAWVALRNAGRTRGITCPGCEAA